MYDLKRVVKSMSRHTSLHKRVLSKDDHKKIRRLHKKGLSQREVADKFGISRKTVYNI